MQEINAIGNILDSTVGRGGDGSRSVTAAISGDVLTLKFATIVNFASETSLRQQADRLTEESIAVLSDRISSLKKEFKDLTGNTLLLKEISNRDSIEIISATANSLRKIAYYRRNAQLQISN